MEFLFLVLFALGGIILNRLRGIKGYFAKVYGIVLGTVVYFLYDNPYVAITVALGFVLGESFGWGVWVGTLSVSRQTTYIDEFEGGKYTGIQWIAQKLVPNYKEEWIKYCNIALGIRGIYWWLPTLAPLYFVGIDIEYIILAIWALGIAFPLACYFGYHSSKKFGFKISFFEMQGGWEHQEVWYGLIQGLVIGSLILA